MISKLFISVTNNEEMLKKHGYLCHSFLKNGVIGDVLFPIESSCCAMPRVWLSFQIDTQVHGFHMVNYLTENKHFVDIFW